MTVDKGHPSTPLPLFRIFIFYFLPFISIELESLTTFELFELGREVNFTENSPLGLGSLILNTRPISLPFF